MSAGGTSWSQVEMHRAPDDFTRRLAAVFVGWGIPTAESIVLVKTAAPNMMVFASGGLRDGIDVAKCLALGATLAGMASHFLIPAAISTEAALTSIQLMLRQLQVTMFVSGVENIKSLRQLQLMQREFQSTAS